MSSQRAVTSLGIGLCWSHSAPEVRQKAIAILSAAGDKAAVPEVQRLLRDPELSVRTEALLFLSHHGHIDPLTVIEQLAISPTSRSVGGRRLFWRSRRGSELGSRAEYPGLDGQRSRRRRPAYRMEAARLLGELRTVFDPLLSRLLADSDTHVVCEAIHSVGMLRKRRLVLSY